MADEFNKGDVVQLKSGGAQMVVDSVQDGVSGGRVAFCVWLDGTKPRRESFGFHLLKPAKKPKSDGSPEADSVPPAMQPLADEVKKYMDKKKS